MQYENTLQKTFAENANKQYAHQTQTVASASDLEVAAMHPKQAKNANMWYVMSTKLQKCMSQSSQGKQLAVAESSILSMLPISPVLEQKQQTFLKPTMHDGTLPCVQTIPELEWWSDNTDGQDKCYVINNTLYTVHRHSASAEPAI